MPDLSLLYASLDVLGDAFTLRDIACQILLPALVALYRVIKRRP